MTKKTIDWLINNVLKGIHREPEGGTSTPVGAGETS